MNRELKARERLGLAAAVVRAFWGLFYRRTENLAAPIVSRSVWSTFIFTVISLR